MKLNFDYAVNRQCNWGVSCETVAFVPNINCYNLNTSDSINIYTE